MTQRQVAEKRGRHATDLYDARGVRHERHRFPAVACCSDVVQRVLGHLDVERRTRGRRRFADDLAANVHRRAAYRLQSNETNIFNAS